MPVCQGLDLKIRATEGPEIECNRSRLDSSFALFFSFDRKKEEAGIPRSLCNRFRV